MELRIAGLRSAQIAKRLNMTPAAVRKRESRAIERLRQLNAGDAL
jgi:DNA-directed RNA polymerase specialized sigma24 family protein